MTGIDVNLSIKGRPGNCNREKLGYYEVFRTGQIGKQHKYSNEGNHTSGYANIPKGAGKRGWS